MNHSLFVWVRTFGLTWNESLPTCLSDLKMNQSPLVWERRKGLTWITPYLSIKSRARLHLNNSLPVCQSKAGPDLTWITPYLSIKNRAWLVLNHSLLVNQKQGLTWLESLPTCQSKAGPDLTWITPYLSIKSRAWLDLNHSLLFNQKGQETSQLIGSGCLFLNNTQLIPCDISFRLVWVRLSTAAVRAAPPFLSVCSVLWCVQTVALLPVSHCTGVCKLRTDVDACGSTRKLYGHRR